MHIDSNDDGVSHSCDMGYLYLLLIGSFFEGIHK